MAMRMAGQTLIAALALILVGGLVIVSVHKVRESAARMACMSNLRQIGLCCHNYHSYKGRFPWAAEPNPGLPAERRLSWLVSIGPFVEATDLFVRLDRDKGWDAPENRYLGLTSWRVFHCPRFPDLPPPSPFVSTHYIGIAGLGETAAALPQGSSRAGFFGYDRNLPLDEIEAHTSTLLMVIETTQIQGAWTAGGFPTVRGLDETDPRYLGRAGQFGGIHRGGANALFADASVRFLDESINPRVLEALATITGSKETDSLDDS
jgi:prepilin-type processing-associated H-X9-DG protein